MFNSLKKIFNQVESAPVDSVGDLQLLCGIMIETANVDGVFDQLEINKISQTLIDVFGEDPKSVEVELQKCVDELKDHKSFHFFTSRINQSFNHEKKLILIEILWEIILVDGKIHDFESNLIRRLSGLLYISDFDCGKAKKKILEKLHIKD